MELLLTLNLHSRPNRDKPSNPVHQVIVDCRESSIEEALAAAEEKGFLIANEYYVNNETGELMDHGPIGINVNVISKVKIYRHKYR